MVATMVFTLLLASGIIAFWCEFDPLIPGLERGQRNDLIVSYLRRLVEDGNARFLELANLTSARTRSAGGDFGAHFG